MDKFSSSNTTQHQSSPLPSLTSPLLHPEANIEFYTKPFHWNTSNFTKGFNISTKQFREIEEWVTDLLLLDNLYAKEIDSEVQWKLMQIGEALTAQFPCLTKVGIPEFWSVDARRALVKSTRKGMRIAGEKLGAQIERKKRTVRKDKGLLKIPKALKVPKTRKTNRGKRKTRAQDVNYDEDDDSEDREGRENDTPATKKKRVLARMEKAKEYAVTPVLGTPEIVQKIPLKDLIEPENLPEEFEDIDPDFLSFGILISNLQQSGLISSLGDRLCYRTLGEGSFPVIIASNNDLKNAAIALRTIGASKLSLEVVPAGIPTFPTPPLQVQNPVYFPTQDPTQTTSHTSHASENTYPHHFTPENTGENESTTQNHPFQPEIPEFLAGIDVDFFENLFYDVPASFPSSEYV
ncbi:hypothetical protein HYFRA_00000540 [Hymenoscyphus fraxineus]|uniref:Uncharacterized protein n=1 Tax=Hymenoscyphus fraxineus TaxID=746836 RepID=A0A9N9L4V2_9HELO|nr:hypothetical protein HYFRA_00000540 [Hymenoscyphus fraxineus]